MTLPPIAKANWDRLRDFNDAMSAASGLSRSSDERGRRFDELLKEGGFKQSGLDGVASTLMENIRRVLAQASLPTMIFDYGREYQSVVEESCAKHRFAAEPQQLFLAGTSAEHMREEGRKLVLLTNDVRDWLFGIQQRVPLNRGSYFFAVAGIACNPHEQLSGYQEKDKRSALADFCASLVIQSWTMFEAISEDLWVAALNSHPATLAKLKCRKWRSKFGKPPKIEEEESVHGDQQQGRSILISLDNLQKDGFDLSKRMGAVLRRRFSFQAIDGIRSAYFQAFSKDASDIDAVLNDDGLQLAAAVRHVLIHKRGVVDKEFLRQTAVVSGDFPKVQEHDPYPLTGKICAELTDACRCCSTALVVAVHDWIVAHPASSSGGSDE